MDAALAAQIEAPRKYLGASQIGGECNRQIQYELRGVEGDPIPGKLRRIFARGHILETAMWDWMKLAGFSIITRHGGYPIGFSVCDGQYRGHIDGSVIDGPEIEGLIYPCIWECKWLGAKGWKAVVKDGVAKAYPKYADQVSQYQFYKDNTNPALMTFGNADTMEIWAELVPFDAARAQAASDRAVNILLAERAGELLPRVSSGPDNYPCAWCRHSKTCWEST